MFIDGLKLLIIGFIYSIPLFVIMVLFLIPAGMLGNGDPVAALGAIGIGLLVMIIVGIVIRGDPIIIRPLG